MGKKIIIVKRREYTIYAVEIDYFGILDFKIDIIVKHFLFGGEVHNQ